MKKAMEQVDKNMEIAKVKPKEKYDDEEKNKENTRSAIWFRNIRQAQYL